MKWKTANQINGKRERERESPGEKNQSNYNKY